MHRGTDDAAIGAAIGGAGHALRRRRRAVVSATPTSPVPTSNNVLGSGTGFAPSVPPEGADVDNATCCGRADS
jgi:hypothetical protein